MIHPKSHKALETNTVTTRRSRLLSISKRRTAVRHAPWLALGAMTIAIGLITATNIFVKNTSAVVNPTGGNNIYTYVANGTNGTNGVTYQVHVFTGNGTFNTNGNDVKADYLVVGGGGGGGATLGGGGGAGEFVEGATVVTSGTRNVVVGDGGQGKQSTGTSGDLSGANGGNSSFVAGGITITALGGGGGGGYVNNGKAGGSGGGGGIPANTTGTQPGGGTTAGGSGGTGTSSTNSGGYGKGSGYPSQGGGGGGAGSVGGNGTGTTANGPDGGSGKSSSITGASVDYAGGGGGSTNSTGKVGGIGKAGGGTGGYHYAAGTNATANTGSGGGGGGNYLNAANAVNRYGGSGGSGIVIVRYSTSTYTIEYDGNGNTSGTKPASQLGSNTWALQNQNTLAKTGYLFDGWNTQANYLGTHYNAGDTITLTANLTLYAQWTPITYQVAFNANSGTGTMANESFTYDATAKALTTNAFTKTGYTFAGWNTAADGTGTNFANSQSVTNLTATSGGVVTLYAKWSVNAYSLIYNGNTNTTGTAPATVTQDYNTTATVSGAASLAKTGYSFAGWNTASDGSGTSYAAGATFNFNTTANTTLYAQWTDLPPTLTITAPTKLKNSNITDTTIKVTDGVGIDSVTIDPSSTATAGSIVCTPSLPYLNTDPVNVSQVETNCTIVISGSGDLVIATTDSAGNVVKQTVTNYIVDTIPPAVPTVQVDTTTGIDTPTLTFSSSDNIAVDHYEIVYTNASGVLTTLTPATSPVQLSLDPNELTTGPDYTHTIVVKVYDTAGNVSTTTIKFPPLVTFTTPTTISNATITNATVTITSPAGNPLDQIQLLPGTTGASLGTCTGAGGDTTAPYDNPVTCQINGVSTSGTITVTGRDSVTLATGQNMTSFVIETTAPIIAITAPTKLSNTAITTTTIAVTDNYAIDAANVAITATNTTGGFSISNVSCVQTNTSRVDCTLQINGIEGTGDITVTATDQAGNTANKTEAGYVIDTTPPTVTIDQAASQSDPTNTSPVSFTIVFSEPVTGLNTGDIVLSGTTGTVSSLTTVDNKTFTVTVSGMTDGDIITATVPASAASDAAGNPNTASTSTDNTVTYDITIPTGTATSLNTQDPSPALTGTVSDPTATVTVTINGTTYTATNNGDGTWTLPDNTIAPALNEGTYLVTATFTDPAGNSSTATANVVVDHTPPLTPVDAPDLRSTSDTGSSDTDNITSDNTPTFDVTCTELNSVITLYVDGVAHGTVLCTLIGTTQVTASPSLADGVHSITYTETDSFGNTSDQSPSLSITVDTVAPATPTITIDSVTSDNTINVSEASGNVTITGKVTNANTGDTITLTINSQTYTATIDASGNFSVSVAGSNLASDADLTIDASLTTSDTAGNTATGTATKTYVVDTNVPTAPPAADLISSSDSGTSTTDNLTNDNTPTFDVVCSGAGTINLMADGVLVATATCTGAGTIQVTITTPLADGSYDITYTETNGVGNVSPASAPLTITVDTTPPTGTLTTAKTSDTTPALTGTVDDPTATVTVTINGTTYTATNNGDGTWTLPDNTISPALTENDYDITVTFADAAGNSSTTPSTVKLPVSIDPPALTKLAKVTNLATNEVEWTITATNTNDSPQGVTIYDMLPNASKFVLGSVTCTVTSSDSMIYTCDFNASTDPTNLDVTANLAAGETITVLVKTTTAIGETSISNTATASFAADTGTAASSAATTPLSAKAPTNTVSDLLSNTGQAIYWVIGVAMTLIVAAVGVLFFRRRKTS